LEELEKGKFDKDVEDLMKMSKEELKKLYDSRDIEPEDEVESPVTVSSGDKSD
jgi:hypothetical protein